MRQTTKRILATSFFAICWIAAVAFGLRILVQYENTPGRIGTLPLFRPESRIIPATDRPTLVMLAHPRCPCTAASVGELAQIMARLQGKVAAYVLFVTPKDAGRDWDDTSLRHSAESIPGVTVVFDIDGAQASRFGAETSGHTLLFASDGKLLFSGGITGSRGHAGDNPGESAIISLVNNQEPPPRTRTLVFGCALVDRAESRTNAVCLR
ncbi:MAG: hypothetical protein QOD12_2401 [Verrucomicrobiota bacterium]